MGNINLCKILKRMRKSLDDIFDYARKSFKKYCDRFYSITAAFEVISRDFGNIQDYLQ